MVCSHVMIKQWINEDLRRQKRGWQETWEVGTHHSIAEALADEAWLGWSMRSGGRLRVEQMEVGLAKVLRSAPPVLFVKCKQQPQFNCGRPRLPHV